MFDKVCLTILAIIFALPWALILGVLDVLNDFREVLVEIWKADRYKFK